MIGPIIFCTVVSGVASMRDTKKIGRVGGKALLYFEVVTTAALLIGLVVVNLVGPGRGMNINPATLDTSAIAKYTEAAGQQTVADFILHVIPTTFVSAFTEGDLLQVLLIALLSGFALIRMGDLGQRILKGIDAVSVMVFQILGFIMKLAPILSLIHI